MIVLDTDVVSALMLARPDPMVVAWLDRQDSTAIWITSVTIFEVRFGLAILPPGRRRRQLEAAFAATLREDLGDRVLPFDAEAAAAAAGLAAEASSAGRPIDVRPIDVRDVEIAGIVTARGATLATHNTRHFQHLGIALIDPKAAPRT